MGVLSNKISKGKLKIGDHIYSWRIGYVYAHHGIYVGDGKVIHFTREDGQETGTGTSLDRFLVSSSPPKNNNCETCGDQSNPQGVTKSCIDCFLRGGNLYRFLYSVSWPFFVAKARGGTCTLARSDSTAIVLHRANYLLDNGFGTYSLFLNNCEDFAVYCKTGLLLKGPRVGGRSGQLTSYAAGTMAAAFTAQLKVLISTAFGPVPPFASPVAGFAALLSAPVSISVVGCVVAGGSTLYCASRYRHDIGVRKDVVKVDVERLAAHGLATYGQQ